MEISMFVMELELSISFNSHVEAATQKFARGKCIAAEVQLSSYGQDYQPLLRRSRVANEVVLRMRQQGG